MSESGAQLPRRPKNKRRKDGSFRSDKSRGKQSAPVFFADEFKDASNVNDVPEDIHDPLDRHLPIQDADVPDLVSSSDDEDDGDCPYDPDFMPDDDDDEVSSDAMRAQDEFLHDCDEELQHEVQAGLKDLKSFKELEAEVAALECREDLSAPVPSVAKETVVDLCEPTRAKKRKPARDIPVPRIALATKSARKTPVSASSSSSVEQEEFMASPSPPPSPTENKRFKVPPPSNTHTVMTDAFFSQMPSWSESIRLDAAKAAKHPPTSVAAAAKSLSPEDSRLHFVERVVPSASSSAKPLQSQASRMAALAAAKRAAAAFAAAASAKPPSPCHARRLIDERPVASGTDARNLPPAPNLPPRPASPPAQVPFPPGLALVTKGF